MYAWDHFAPNYLFNSRDTSLILMVIWDYYFHVIVYVFTTDVEKCDLIIRFYVIKFFFSGPHPKWNSGGGNITCAGGDKWKVGVSAFTIDVDYDQGNE